jgi:pyridoxamine 5'-phosphate oxidase
MTDEQHDVANMRVHYDRDVLHESDLAATPLEQFRAWLGDAVALGADVLIEPNAMVLSTSDAAGVVSSRSVLLKGIDDRGLVFYTNYGSHKAQHIADHPQVSVVFPWYPLHRQVIVSGTISKVSRAESQEYFATRPHKSKLGAMVSEQSALIASRDVLEVRMEELQEQYPTGSEVPMPEFWGGYLISVDTMEFWQGRRSRLHDRLRFVRTGEQHDLSNPSGWQVIRLSP